MEALTDDKPGDPLAALGDSVALGYGDGIAEAIRGQFKDRQPSGRVAFCAPGNEMLAAVTCSLYGERGAEIRAHPCLAGEDLYVMDAEGPEVICDGGRPLWPQRWSLLRHGTWNYRVTALKEGEEVTFGPLIDEVTRYWHAPPSRRLCVDGHEYHRRQRARAKGKRR